MDGSGQAEQASVESPPARRFVETFFELSAMCGFAIAQPLLDVFGRDPGIFLLNRVDARGIVVFAVGVVVVPPLALWVVEWHLWLLGEVPRAWFHRACIGVLTALIAARALKQAGLDPAVVVAAISVLVAIAVVALVVRSAGVRLWLRYSALGAVIFAVAFLRWAPVSALVGSSDTAVADIDGIGARPVVVVVTDEWPTDTLIDADGQIDGDLYPNIAALAADSTWFRNATSVGTNTAYAVPAIATGRHPAGTAVPVASDHPQSLFTLLGGVMSTNVIEPVTRLCPANVCDAPADPEVGSGGLAALAEPTLDTYRQMVDPFTDVPEEATAGFDPRVALDRADQVARDAPTTAGSSANALVTNPVENPEGVDQFIDGLEPGPSLNYLHLLLPHFPYRFLPSGQEYAVPESELEAPPSAMFVDQRHQRLLLQAGYTDRLLGEILDRLRTLEIYDEAIIVLVADHGTGLVGQLPTRGNPVAADVPEALYADLLYVPLIVKGPGVEPGAVSDMNAMTVDVVPTIADLLDVEIPWAVDGVSLVGEGRTDPLKRFNHNSSAGDRVWPTVTFDGTGYLQQMLDRNVDTFLRGDNERYPLFDITEGGELVGRAVDTYPSGSAADTPVLRYEDADALGSVDAETGLAHARLSGRLEGGPAGVRPLVAVSVGGRIAAVTRPFELFSDGVRHIETMLAPDLLAPDGEVRFHVVEGSTGAWQLRPLSARPL